jgi:hypothetical protein
MARDGKRWQVVSSSSSSRSLHSHVVLQDSLQTKSWGRKVLRAATKILS